MGDKKGLGGPKSFLDLRNGTVVEIKEGDESLEEGNDFDEVVLKDLRDNIVDSADLRKAADNETEKIAYSVAADINNVAELLRAVG